MNDKEMLDLLFLSQKSIVFSFCVVFGFAAREAYQSLKGNYQFKRAIPKLILSFFVCVVSIPIINQYQFGKDYFPICILIISFLYMPIADFIAKDLLNAIINKLSNKQKMIKDE